MNKPAHITKGNVLDDLGFSHSEASALKIKAVILDAILDEIHRRGFSQSALVDVLDEYQPQVSNLLHGRITKMSIERLLGYADRLRMRSSIALRPPVRPRPATPTKTPSRSRTVAA